MSFLTKNAGIPVHSILVLEPYDIPWLGIHQMLQTAMDRNVSLIRISDTNKLSSIVQHHPIDTVLLSAIGQRTEVLPLLQQLSLIMHSHRRVHIVAYLHKKMPHLADLLLGFGVNNVLTGPMDEVDLAYYLAPVKPECQPVRLTLQERNVAQALLTGKSVTHVAQLMHRDVRTISAHTQSLIGKLNMVSRGELQVLGGRLMVEETSV